MTRNKKILMILPMPLLKEAQEWGIIHTLEEASRRLIIGREVKNPGPFIPIFHPIILIWRG